MSLRSHVFAAVVPLVAWVGIEHLSTVVLEGKAAEIYQLDIRMSKQALRTCGVAKLRASTKISRVLEDNMFGGLIVELGPNSGFGVDLMPISEVRTRIRVSWPSRDQSPETFRRAQAAADTIAEIVVPCGIEASPA